MIPSTTYEQVAGVDSDSVKIRCFAAAGLTDEEVRSAIEDGRP